MGLSLHGGGHGGGMGARTVEVRADRVLAGAMVPGAVSGGRETGIAWAWRGLSLASHAGVIAAAVAVAGPQPAAVIEAYTVEIVFSDRVAGGHGEGTDLPPAPSPGAAGASPAYRSRGGDTPLVPPEAADPADADSPTVLDPPSVLPGAGPTPPAPPARGSRPGARARFPGPPPRKPHVPQRPREIAETSPAPAEPSADAAGKAPPAKPAPAPPPPDTPVGTSPPQLETFVASAAPGAAGASPAYRSRGDTPLVPPVAEEKGAAPVARAPGVSSRETTGGAKRVVSAAGYAAGHLGNVPPVYPYRARRKEIEGRVVLRVQVLPGGTARSVEVLSSSGHAILDRAALKAVRAWRFVPAKRGGVPVAGAIDVPITFRLAD